MEVVGSYMDKFSRNKRAFLPPVSLSNDDCWDKSNPNLIKFEFGMGGGGWSGGEVVLVARREGEEDSVVVRGTISLEILTSEIGLSRRVSRERKWVLPVEEEEVEVKVDSQKVEGQEIEGQDFEEDHLAAKVIGQKLDEEDHFEAKVVKKELEEQEHLEAKGVVDWIRGEVKQAALRPEQQSGGRRRSPRVQARRLARLLQFQKGLWDLQGLPPTHLQKKKVWRKRLQNHIFLLQPSRGLQWAGGRGGT